MRKLKSTAAVLAGLTLACAADARSPTAAALAARLQAAAARQQAAVAFAPAATELNNIKVMLELADRNYKGHRAAAVKEISSALRTLTPHRKGQGQKVGPAGEPQALSDAQLRDAVTRLNKVGATLSGFPGNRAAKAANHVGAAIKELQTALTIK